MPKMINQTSIAYRRNITKAYLIQYCMMSHIIAGVLIPFFTEWGGITFAQVMILQAVFTLSMSLMEVPTGAIADHFGRKVSLALAGLLSGIAGLIYVTAPNFWIFVLAEICWGTGLSLMSGADQAMLYDSLRKLGEESRSKKIFGQWHSMGLMALTIAAPIGSVIAKYWGLRATMFCSALPMFVGALVACTLTEPDVGERNVREPYLARVREGFRYLRGHKILHILAFDYVSISVLSFFLIWSYQVVLQRLDVAIEWFGIVSAALTMTQVIVLNNFTGLDRLFREKRRYLFWSAIFAGCGFVIMGIAQRVWIAIVGMLLLSAFGMTRRTLFQSYMNKFVDSHHRATVMSVVAMFYSLSAAMMNVCLGYLVDWNLRITLMMVGGAVIAFAVFSRVREEHLLD